MTVPAIKKAGRREHPAFCLSEVWVYTALYTLSLCSYSADIRLKLVSLLSLRFPVLFCLFSLINAVRLCFLSGSISTATAVPTLPESFLRGHRFLNYASFV